MPCSGPPVFHHGAAPARIAVLHGGPGGAGEVAPLARALGARGYGVLEPYQTAPSISGQIEELRSLLTEGAQMPVTLIGWSWGAWLALLFASRHRSIVDRVILIGCPPFDPAQARTIGATRMARLTSAEQNALADLETQLADPEALARYLELYDRADSVARDDSPAPLVTFDPQIHKSVWAEAKEMRESGALLLAAETVTCPVTAIHGAEDPHPFGDISPALSPRIADFTFHLLLRCGHKPWQERHAKLRFFECLDRALSQQPP